MLRSSPPLPRKKRTRPRGRARGAEERSARRGSCPCGTGEGFSAQGASCDSARETRLTRSVNPEIPAAAESARRSVPRSPRARQNAFPPSLPRRVSRSRAEGERGTGSGQDASCIPGWRGYAPRRFPRGGNPFRGGHGHGGKLRPCFRNESRRVQQRKPLLRVPGAEKARKKVPLVGRGRAARRPCSTRGMVRPRSSDSVRPAVRPRIEAASGVRRPNCRRG